MAACPYVTQVSTFICQPYEPERLTSLNDFHRRPPPCCRKFGLAVQHKTSCGAQIHGGNVYSRCSFNSLGEFYAAPDGDIAAVLGLVCPRYRGNASRHTYRDCSGTIRRSVSEAEGSEATTFEPPRKVAVTCQR